MSNLSELLPAGSSVKSADFVAQGTLASGVTVALRSDGKVEAVSSSSVTEQLGSAVVFESASSGFTAATFDSVNNKVVIAYQDNGNSNYGTAIVGTVSGTSISFGTPVLFESATIYHTSATFDSNSNKVVIAYRDAGNSNYGTAIIGTVSGTSISFGSAVVFETANANYESVVFDSNSNKIVIAYRDEGNSSFGTAIVGTVSGTSISFGSAVVFNSGTTSPISATFDSNSNKVVIAYPDSGNSGYGTAIVGTVSGTSISFGSEVVYESANTNGNVSAVFDSSNNKVVIAYPDNGNSSYGTAIVGTVSGTSISFGSPTVFESAYAYEISATFDSNANKVVVAYTDIGNSSYGTLVVGTVSGTSISFSSPSVFESADTQYSSPTFDSNLNKVVIAYKDGGNSGYGTSVVFQNASTSTNVSSYVGITDQAISSAATGKVVCKGGAITNTGLLPYAPVAGTPVTFEAAYVNYTNCAFDSASNKIVIAYTDTGNSNYGTAIVGTVSGSSISYGSPVVIATNQARYFAVVFDSNANKIVIAYQNQDNTYGQAIVGTVSGTSISFGTAVTFEAASARYVNAAFDSTVNKVIISYRDDGNSSYGTAIVGTVSGTSISFGTAAVYNAAETAPETTVYDSSTNKTVILYSDVANSYYATAVVATVSGTSISFGSEVVIHSGSTTHIAGAFDSNSNKVVVAYGGSSTLAKSRVGTVSGTSISFGTEATMIAGGGAYDIAATFDSTLNQMVVSFNFYNGSSSQGIIVAGTVSGTNISFGATTVFDTGPDQIYHLSSAFDTNANRTVTVYQAQNDNNYGKAVVSALSNTLTPNTAYFVQDDGTISTTSSTTKAGTALSTTSLLLTG